MIGWKNDIRNSDIEQGGQAAMGERVIRVFVPEELPRIQQIAVGAFEGVSIDRNIERKYGLINGVD